MTTYVIAEPTYARHAVFRNGSTYAPTAALTISAIETELGGKPGYQTIRRILQGSVGAYPNTHRVFTATNKLMGGHLVRHDEVLLANSPPGTAPKPDPALKQCCVFLNLEKLKGTLSSKEVGDGSVINAAGRDIRYANKAGPVSVAPGDTVPTRYVEHMLKSLPVDRILVDAVFHFINTKRHGGTLVYAQEIIG